MPNHQLLDNINHKYLHVINEYRPGLGDEDSHANIVISEFREAQAHYPLFFRKHGETGQFEVISIFGFGKNENLYLTENGWGANYIPLSVQRRPFLIGFQNVQKDGVLQQEPVVFVDMDSPKVVPQGSSDQGTRVFLEMGGQTEYLQNINSILQTLHTGHQQTKAFIDFLVEQDLIESVVIKVTLNDNSNNELNSLYTVNEEKVAGLTGDNLNALHAKGYLQLIHMMQASFANLSELIEKKNATL